MRICADAIDIFQMAFKTKALTTCQYHRMFGVGRDLCGSSSPTPLPKQGHLQQATQDLVQAGLEYLQRRRHEELLERVQLRATRMMRGLEHLSYKKGRGSWACSA